MRANPWRVAKGSPIWVSNRRSGTNAANCTKIPYFSIAIYMLPCSFWPKCDVWLSGLVLTCQVKISIICRVFSLSSPHTCDCTAGPRCTNFADAASQGQKWRVARSPLQYERDPATIHTAITQLFHNPVRKFVLIVSQYQWQKRR